MQETKTHSQPWWTDILPEGLGEKTEEIIAKYEEMRDALPDGEGIPRKLEKAAQAVTILRVFSFNPDKDPGGKGRKRCIRVIKKYGK